MRLVLEIIIVGILLTFALTFMGDKNDAIEQSEQRVETYQDSLALLDDSLSALRNQVQHYKQREVELEDKLAEKEDKEKQIKDAYRDSINKVKTASLSELIDSTQKIIEGKNGDHVVVREAFFRQAKQNQVELKKMKSLVGIYQDKVAIQDSMLELKDEAITNLMARNSVLRHKVGLKDTIITEKNIQLEGKDQVIRRYKWQRNLVIGGAVAGALLIIF